LTAVALFDGPIYDRRNTQRKPALTRERRKLAAIMVLDAVGYSRLMERDESGTLAILTKHRTSSSLATALWLSSQASSMR